MKRNIYALIVILTLFIISIIMFKFVLKTEKYCFFNIIYNDISFNIKYWYDDKENYYYVFLPTFADTQNIKIKSNTKVYINNVEYIDGEKLNNINIDEEYSFIYDNINEGKIKFLKDENTASMFIETQSKSMDNIHKDKDYKEIATMSLINNQGDVEYNSNLNYIKGRGNSTWTREKKPYNIQLSQKTDLLDMGEAQNWVLLSNFIDKTNLRNKMVYDFANKIGLEYSPNSEFVHLYLNGEYTGLYLLSEKIEICENRIDIASDEYDITGPFLLEKEIVYRYQEEPRWISTNRGLYFVIKNNSEMNEEKMHYIKNLIQNLEDAIYNKNNNISEYIDLDSWTKKYLLEEFFGNFDANNTSTFFYKKIDKNSKLIYAGPVWDYDGAVGNLEKYNFSEEYIVNIEDSIWKELMENEVFYESVVNEFNNNFLSNIEYLLDNYIDEISNKTYNSTMLDYIRWKNDSEQIDTTIYKVYDTYEENMKHLKTFLTERKEFLKLELNY